MSDDALRQQRQRGQELRNLCRKDGDRAYDPDAALLRRFHPYFMRFTGHTVAQNSIDYAIVLLHSDDRIYGTDDSGEANRIIQAILRYQDRRSDSETFGNFFWMTHWDRVKDKNAVSFLAVPLAYSYLTLADKLSQETKEALLDAFPHVVTALRHHRERGWRYTNIFFLNLGGLVSISRAIGDISVEQEAAGLFDEWLTGTSDDGFHEYNSPGYSAVTLFGLEAAWAYATEPEFRARLERALDVLSYQAAVNLLPNGFLGGAYARAYHENVIGGASGLSVYAHLKFGTPLTRFGITAVRSTLFDYVPPEAVRALAHHKAPAIQVHDRVLSLGSVRTHHMTPTYSLGSQTLRTVGGHSPPPYVMVVRNVPGSRCSVPILPDESFSHQPCAVFEAHQQGSRLVGRLHYELAEPDRARFLADHTFRCEPRMLFGHRDDIEEVWVQNVDWAGGDLHLRPGQPVAVSYGQLMIGVVALPVARSSGDPQSGHLSLSYGTDEELRLHLCLFGGPDLGADDHPVDVVLLVDVADHGSSLRDYADWLAGWRLSQTAGTGEVRVMAEHPDETGLQVSTVPPGPDEVLHSSPHLTLRVGDLRKLVTGEIPHPFRVTGTAPAGIGGDIT